MTAVLSEPVSVDAANVFDIGKRFDGPFHIVELSGELDLAARAAAIEACASPGHLHVLVDLSGLTFMDCAGYGALVAATSILDHRGGSLTMMNPVGEPRRLLTLLEAPGLGLCAPVRYGDPYLGSAEPVAS
jgi:anti-anti-sigma factor